jgi:hypothetical protein
LPRYIKGKLKEFTYGQEKKGKKGQEGQKEKIVFSLNPLSSFEERGFVLCLKINIMN